MLRTIDALRFALFKREENEEVWLGENTENSLGP